MTEAMAHRGPDGVGEFHDTHIAMAMRRLSIIDLDCGWQPLYNEDRSLFPARLMVRFTILLNCENNYSKKEHQFSTMTDCETILHLYEEYGLDCVQHLRGMFAFALWNTRQQRLV